MAQRSGINRSLMWLRKVLQITEETDSPRVLSEILTPAIDVFGWERYFEAQFATFAGAAATSSVVSLPTPADVLRVITGASVESTDPASLTMWIAKRTEPGSVQFGVSAPTVAVAGIQCPLKRRVIVPPTERLVGRSVPAPAAATALTIRLEFIDIPIGEYLKSL